MSNFFTILGLILSILGAIVSAVIISTVFVYFVWLILNPSQAKQKLASVKSWAKQWLPTNKKKGNGISKLLIFIILFVLSIISFAIWYIYTHVNIEDDFNRPWWVWGICILVAAIGTYSYLAIKQKIPWSWKFSFPLWARWFVGLAITGVILWFLWPSIGLRFYFGGSDAASIATNNRPMQRTTSSSQQYSKLNISGSNDMKKGIWKKFSIRRDGDPLWFTPAIAQGDTLTYYFKKVEDETRSWAVQAWIDSNGEPVEKHITSDEPYPEAQLGECLVSTDKDVVVVVEVKKKK